MIRPVRPWSCVLVVLALAVGCGHEEPLPRAPQLAPPDALRHMAEADAKLHSVGGEGTVTLTRKDGQSVRLDAAIAAEFPQRIRLRAWKLGQAVFDMTLTPDGVWMLVADPSRRDKLLPAGVGASRMMRGWASLHSDFYTDPRLVIRDVDDKTFYLERPGEEGGTIRAEVDRQTLVVRRHTVLDQTRTVRFTIDYDRYAMIDGVPWPRRIKAHGGDGVVLVSLDDVQINVPLPDGALTPPRRAEKLP